MKLTSYANWNCHMPKLQQAKYSNLLLPIVCSAGSSPQSTLAPDCFWPLSVASPEEEQCTGFSLQWETRQCHPPPPQKGLPAAQSRPAWMETMEFYPVKHNWTVNTRQWPSTQSRCSAWIVGLGQVHQLTNELARVSRTEWLSPTSTNKTGIVVESMNYSQSP